MNLLKSSFVISYLVLAIVSQAQPSFKASKAVFKFTKDLISVPLGSFTMGRKTVHKYLDKDSTLFSGDYIRLVKMEQPYYISNHEVTNAEYKEFVDWTIESFAKRHDNPILADGKIDYKKVTYTYALNGEQKSVVVHPDTTVWTNDFKYSFNEPMTQLYYKHEAYADYPVVGISWEQANAYCDWRTNRVIDLMKTDHPGQNQVKFRLPTEAEWEYAALGTVPADKKTISGKKPKEKTSKAQIFPWEGPRLNDDKGKYYANFGMVVDQNDIVIKSYFEDGAFHTAPTKSYAPNAFELYDMAGNVAEWVADEAQLLQWKDTLGNMVRVDANDDEQTICSKLLSMVNPMGQPMAEYLKNPGGKATLTDQARILLHDIKVLKINPDARIVKGGSWATGAVFMQCGAKEALSENKASSRVGFRVVMTTDNKTQSAER